MADPADGARRQPGDDSGRPDPGANGDWLNVYYAIGRLEGAIDQTKREFTETIGWTIAMIGLYAFILGAAMVRGRRK